MTKVSTATRTVSRRYPWKIEMALDYRTGPCDISAMLGETIVEISGSRYDAATGDLLGVTGLADVTGGIKELIFTVTSGFRFRMHHDQGCCESVALEDVAGDLGDLIGSPIVMAEESTYGKKDDVDHPRDDESYTWTFYKLGTAKGSVTLRWYGSSSGYYSEDMSMERIGVPCGHEDCLRTPELAAACGD